MVALLCIPSSLWFNSCSPPSVSVTWYDYYVEQVAIAELDEKQLKRVLFHNF